MTAGLIGAVAGLVAGFAAKRWLDTRAYRYDDEMDIRPRSHAWVLLAMPLALAGVSAGQYAVDSLVLAVVSTVIAAVLVTVAAIDLDVRRLPDKFTGPLAVGTVLALLAVAGITGEWSSFGRALLGALALGAGYLVLALIGGGTGMGLGDVKLAPTLGLLLGWHSWTHLLIGSAAAFVLGGLISIVLVIFTKRGRKSTIPFGPFMVLGCLVVLSLPALSSR